MHGQTISIAVEYYYDGGLLLGDKKDAEQVSKSKGDGHCLKKEKLNLLSTIQSILF